ncbi:MAG: hypothetical protein EOO21_04285, partial [Comamonadaceae bacterium]
PALTDLIREAIGDAFLDDTEKLDALAAHADDAAFQSRFEAVKRANKVTLAQHLKELRTRTGHGEAEHVLASLKGNLRADPDVLRVVQAPSRSICTYVVSYGHRHSRHARPAPTVCAQSAQPAAAAICRHQDALVDHRNKVPVRCVRRSRLAVSSETA